jgi:hypothetical protein
LPPEERWPITALELPEVNKPQARISGVGIFHSSPLHSNTCIEVTSGTYSGHGINKMTYVAKSAFILAK